MSKAKLPKGFGKDMLSGFQRLKEGLARAQAELAEETIEASAGGGAVRVVMTGTQQCQAVTVAPQLLEDGDVEMLQDLIALAVNQAIRDSQELASRKLGPLTGGLEIPGMSE